MTASRAPATKRSIGRLVAVQLLVVAGTLTAAPAEGGFERPLAVAAAALGFTVAGSVQMHIELRRHACAVTLVEAVLVVALLFLSPVAAVVAAAIGEGIFCFAQRQPARQLAFNVSATAAAAAVAAAAFALVTAGDPDLGRLVIGALAAAVCYGTASLVSTVTVLSLVERRSFVDVASTSVAPAVVATLVSASLGLVAVVLVSVSPLAVLLVVPLVAMMVVGTRGLASQRAEQLRFERLYEASARTGELQGLHDALATLADEARELVTGAVAVCATVMPGGSWEAVLVADAGMSRLPRDATEVLLQRFSGFDGEAAGDEITDDVREIVGAVGSVTAVHVRDAAAPVLLVVGRTLPTDRSARTRAEVLAAFSGHASLTIANARLYAEVEDALARQVDLNRQKDDFVAVVSHELRTPLTSMIGAVSSLSRSWDRLDPDRITMLTDIALRQSGRLKQLIEELLLLATVEHGGAPTLAPRPVDLVALVSDVAGDVASLDAEGAVEVTVSGGGVAILDGPKVRQILVNLIDNARKYAPGAVEVTIAAHRDRVVLDVVDHGGGIRAEDRERVFERFVQLDQTATRAVGGTGLGLYLCRQLARVLGGSLVLSEGDGGGCRFTLTLPGPGVAGAEQSADSSDSDAVDGCAALRVVSDQQLAPADRR